MKAFFIHWVVVGALLLCFESCSEAKEKILWFKKQERLPQLVIPDPAKGNEQKAAKLFQTLFQQMTGETLVIRTESSLQKADTLDLIFIGNTRAFQQLVKRSWKQQEVHKQFAKRNLYFYAPQNVNLFVAVNHFFEERFGVTYMDARELKVNPMEEYSMEEFAQTETAAFNFRQAFFPASRDYDYMNFHGLHSFEELWSVWGHNLNKIIQAGNGSTPMPQEIYAMQQGARNSVQYCFSSEDLYQQLVRGIEVLRKRQEDLTYFSIAPNDNGVVCTCKQCLSINHGMTSATNSLSVLLNRLAQRFPELTFTTLAYASALEAGDIKLQPNVTVILSTLAEPKGLPISSSPTFTNLISQWKKNCKQLYIWDYTVQYTNFNAPFPNLPVLQKDLQFFQQQNIQGVFEHGSEDQFSLFGDLKSFVIGKWLWNPQLNYDSLKKRFFAIAYPQSGKALYDFLQTIENNQVAHPVLDVYGNVSQDIPVLYTETDVSNLLNTIRSTKVLKEEQQKLLRIQEALQFLLLENARCKGFAAGGSFLINEKKEVLIQPKIQGWVSTLAGVDRNYTETGENFTHYAMLWEQNRQLFTGINWIAKKTLKVSTPSDNYTNTAHSAALTDGVLGLLDYASGYLIYNNIPLEIDINSDELTHASSLSFCFLQSPKHHLFFPSKIEWYDLTPDGQEVRIGQQGIVFDSEIGMERRVLSIPINFIKNKNIRIRVFPASQSIIQDGSNKLPGIACDEVIIR